MKKADYRELLLRELYKEGVNMDEMKKKTKQVDIIMAIIMSVCMGILFAIIARFSADPKALESMPPLPIALLISILESVIVGVIIVLIIPMGKIGRAITTKFNANPGSIKHNALNCLPFAVINAVLISAICSFISIAQAHSHIPADQAPPLFVMWITNWLRLLPLSIVVSYVLAFVIAPFVVKAVGLGGPPKGAGRP